MMSPKIPTQANVADLQALAEVLSVPKATRALLADISQSLEDSRRNFTAANDKAAEAMAALVKIAMEKANLVAREQALAQKAAAVAESHALITKRETAVSILESGLSKTADAFYALRDAEHAQLLQREQFVTETLEKTSQATAAAGAIQAEYMGRLQKLRALAG